MGVVRVYSTLLLQLALLLIRLGRAAQRVRTQRHLTPVRCLSTTLSFEVHFAPGRPSVQKPRTGGAWDDLERVDLFSGSDFGAT